MRNSTACSLQHIYIQYILHLSSVGFSGHGGGHSPWFFFCWGFERLPRNDHERFLVHKCHRLRDEKKTQSVNRWHSNRTTTKPRLGTCSDSRTRTITVACAGSKLQNPTSHAQIWWRAAPQWGQSGSWPFLDQDGDDMWWPWRNRHDPATYLGTPKSPKLNE